MWPHAGHMIKVSFGFKDGSLLVSMGLLQIEM